MYKNNLKILIIDDDINMQTLFKAIIKKYFETEADSSLLGEEGIKLMQENDYHIVFIDQNLPDIKGLEILDKINLSPKDPVFIIMSANEIELDGAVQFLQKPISPTKIKNLIEGLLKNE